jgi:regulator of replication initiation timing
MSNIFEDINMDTSRISMSKRAHNEKSISLMSRKWNDELPFLSKAKECNQISLLKDLNHSHTSSQIERNLDGLSLEVQIQMLKESLSDTRKYAKRLESQNKALAKENWKLRDTIREKDNMIKFYQSNEKALQSQKTKIVQKNIEIRYDASSSNDELIYCLNNLLSKLPEGKSYRVMYKYLSDCMKYVMKSEAWILLKKDFETEAYKGYICDMFLKEKFKLVEIPEKENFFVEIKAESGPVVLGEKEKEKFAHFLVRYFEITAYNILIIPTIHSELGIVGYILFLNKNVDKERLDYNERDQALAAVWSSVTKIFFEIENSHFLERLIKAKTSKMSQIIEEGLSWTNIKDTICLLEKILPEFYLTKRVNIYLWDHKRQEIYKIITEENGTDNLVFFSNQSGIAGKVANEGKLLISNNATTMFQFISKIDDPMGEYHPITEAPLQPPIHIMTIPIYCSHPSLDESYKHFPIAVVQAITKINNMPFVTSDWNDLHSSIQGARLSAYESSQFLGHIFKRCLE